MDGTNLRFNSDFLSLVKPPVELNGNGHHCCEKRFPKEMHGAAITDCVEDTEGRFWATNREYATQVNFCPFCGQPATRKAEELPPDPDEEL